MPVLTNLTCLQDRILGLCNLRDLICLRDQTYRWTAYLPSCLSSGLADSVAQFAIMAFASIHSLLLLSTAVFLDSVPQYHYYQSEAESALATLQHWYNRTTGIYDTTGWWNSANCITVLGNLAAVDNSTKLIATSVFANTLVAAQNYNLQMSKVVDANYLYQSYYGPSTPPGVEAVVSLNPAGFLNGYYDDEGWWALGWIQAYDVTNDTRYLTTAANIFEDMKNGSTTPCSNGTSGIWWDKSETYVNAIANELYLSVASHLANRMSNKNYYLHIALNQWKWFQKSGMVNSQNLINDGLQNCSNNGGTIWSYNQGVILGALVELNLASPDPTYLTRATTIATAAIDYLSDSNNVLHDSCEPNCGNDGSQFKGIFMRNLQKLQSAAPNAVFLKAIEANAASIWSYDRNTANELSVVWSGPFITPANASTQSSAMDALVAAVAFEGELGAAIAS
jgi:predicted alpha-1,6-mannanase (GH76 family)